MIRAKRSELSVQWIRARQRLVLKQMQEKTLGQVLRLFWSMTAAPNIRVKRIPVDSAELTERRLETGRLALAREQHCAPPSRTKSVWVLPERSLVRLQASTPSSVGYHVQPKFETNLPRKTRTEESFKGRLALRSPAEIFLRLI